MGAKYTTGQKEDLKTLAKKYSYKLAYHFNTPEDYEYEPNWYNHIATFAKGSNRYSVEKRMMFDENGLTTEYNIFDGWEYAYNWDKALPLIRKGAKKFFKQKK